MNDFTYDTPSDGPVKPSYFDIDEVLEGLHTAMLFGAPTRSEDRAAFFVPVAIDPSVAVDDEGVPLDPSFRPGRTHTVVQVLCAIEYGDRQVAEHMTILQPTEIEVTLLGPEYDQVVGFEYVVIKGVRYDYRMLRPPVALGNIDVFTILCKTEDQR